MNDTLPSWTDTPTKQAILAFIQAVGDPAAHTLCRRSSGYSFDNDGTLWLEKPVHIHRAVGRRPIMAVGNSDSDIHMLKYAAGHKGSTLGLLVHHDAAREYAYDDGAEKALQLAAREEWLVVSMKNDWKTVFLPSTP